MKYFIKNDIQKDQFMIFCPENLASKADKLLTGLSSLKYAVEHRDRGKKVLFCMKDTFQYSVEVNEQFNSIKIAKPIMNLFYELASQSYCVLNPDTQIKGSLTTILNITDDDVDIYYYKDQLELRDSQLSLSNVVIKFDHIDKRFKNVSPKVNQSFLDNPLMCQWIFQRNLMKKLSELLYRVKNETEKYELQKKQKIHLDPWDYYIVQDSSYFLKFLINTKSFNEFEQILLVHFVIRGVDQDIISYFKEEPDIVIDKYLSFAHNQLLFNEENIFEWLSFQKKNKIVENENESEIENVMNNLNMLLDLFFLDQKENGFQFQYKKDYLD